MSYDIDYLTLLSQQYPTVKAASTEIIRLQSRQKLPKLTEHFMSDIHGEYESFLHILKNASGVIKDKITQIYGRTLSERDRQVLATLIYYPEQKLEYIKDEVDDINDWYKITLYRLIEICRVVASKYTRAKIREFLPEAFGSTIAVSYTHLATPVAIKSYARLFSAARILPVSITTVIPVPLKNSANVSAC